jgi:hypothetical protein
MNIFLAREIAKRLGIRCTLMRASDIPVNGRADDYTYAIVKELGGTAYIRGMGEQRYARSRRWSEDGALEVINIGYADELQHDPTGTWRNGYSVIDLILASPEPVMRYFG